MLWRHAYILGFVLTIGVDCLNPEWVDVVAPEEETEEEDFVLYKRSPNALSEVKRNFSFRKKKVDTRKPSSGTASTQNSKTSDSSTSSPKTSSEKDHSSKQASEKPSEHAANAATERSSESTATESFSAQTAKLASEKSSEMSTQIMLEQSTQGSCKEETTQYASQKEESANLAPKQKSSQKISELSSQQPSQQSCQQAANPQYQQTVQTYQQNNQQPGGQQQCFGQGYQEYPPSQQSYQVFQQSCQPVMQQCLQHSNKLDQTKNELWWTLPIPPMDLQEEVVPEPCTWKPIVCPERLAAIHHQQEVLEKQRQEELAKIASERTVDSASTVCLHTVLTTEEFTSAPTSAMMSASTPTESVVSSTRALATNRSPAVLRTRTPALAAKHGVTPSVKSNQQKQSQATHRKVSVRPQNFLVVSNRDQYPSKGKLSNSTENANSSEVSKKVSAGTMKKPADLAQKKCGGNTAQKKPVQMQKKAQEPAVVTSKTVRRKEKKAHTEKEIVDQKTPNHLDDTSNLANDLYLPVKEDETIWYSSVE